MQRRLEQLNRCLVGWWGNSAVPIPELDFLRRWVKLAWLPKESLRIAMLGRGLLLFEFETMREAKENFLCLEKWNPEVGCFQKEFHANEAWVRVLGLPLHLWSRKVFKKIGDGCGVFITKDEDTTCMAELQWARILVKLDGRSLPSSV